MKNEPEAVTRIREYIAILDENRNTMNRAKYIRLYSESKDSRVLLEYIDQLQGLLDGTLMYNADSQIVPKAPMLDMEVGDMWYMPVTYNGPMKFNPLYEDIGE